MRQQRRRRSTNSPQTTEGSVPEGADPSAVVEADPEQVARNIVLRSLTRAPRTRQQLADLLAERGVPEEVANTVLGRMTDVGLINDTEFAEMYVRSRRATRGLAPRVLATEMRQKGLAPDIIETALADITLGDDRALAADLVARKLAATANLDRERRTRRLVSMLVRKGYGPGLAFDVVREALGAESDDVDATMDV